MRAARLALCALAACGSFQDPNVVLDIRVLGMEADKPEQVIDVDLANPPPASELLAQVTPTTMCALVADPYNARRLAWSMSICPTSGDERCNVGDPEALIGSGFIEDPDVTQPEPAMCAQVLPNADLVAVIQSTLGFDPLAAINGADYEVQLRVGGEGGDPTLDLYASKSLRLSPNVPAPRAPNQNPSLTELDAAVGSGAAAAIALGRCVDQAQPLAVPAGATVRLTPVEAPGARETYRVETLDRKIATFTESLTYEWTATYGSYDNGATGGPPDAAGNLALLYTNWTAPNSKDLKGQPTNVSLWVVQRDERYGAHWYETCVRVTP